MIWGSIPCLGTRVYQLIREVFMGFMCGVCGTTERPSGDPDRCHTCDYWLAYVMEGVVGGTSIVTEDFRVYGVGVEDVLSYGSRGFGGQCFLVEEMSSGQRFVSTNLWTGAEIPERFRGLFHPTHRMLDIRAFSARQIESYPRRYSDGLRLPLHLEYPSQAYYEYTGGGNLPYRRDREGYR
jgi:hypothetical protein